MTGTSHATWRSVGLEASAKIIGELKADSGAVCLYKNGNGGTVDIADKSGTLGPMQWWRWRPMRLWLSSVLKPPRLRTMAAKPIPELRVV
jgi:hypothetical protein